MLPAAEDEQLSVNNFKFVLYASFHSKGESIGYELCKGLESISRELGKSNFEYFVRFSKDEEMESNCNISKWNLDTIEGVIKEFGGNLSKLWVCGTPRMNEDFDKILEKIRRKYDIERHMYEIL